jgi:hypothetical protein
MAEPHLLASHEGKLARVYPSGRVDVQRLGTWSPATLVPLHVPRSGQRFHDPYEARR